MNNLPEEDPKLLNFLRQHRSIAPPADSVLEDRLMSAIDTLPVERSTKSRSWRQYSIGVIGVAIVGILSTIAYQIVNPPQPSMAELQQLNRFLEAHARDDDGDRTLDVDTDLLVDDDPDSES